MQGTSAPPHTHVQGPHRVDLQRLFAPNRSATVHVTRRSRFAPVTVSSRDAQPLGRHYRYRQFVDTGDVVAAVSGWLSELPDDYCVEPSCADERAYWWGVLVERLGRVPCLEGPPSV